MFGGKPLPELAERVCQKQIKAEHRKGTRLILELLSVRAAAWEFGLSRLGKWFSVFRRQSVMIEPWWLQVRKSTYSIISNPFLYLLIAQLSYSNSVVSSGICYRKYIADQKLKTFDKVRRL